MLEHMKSSGVMVPGLDAVLQSHSVNSNEDDQDQLNTAIHAEYRVATPESTASVPLPTPTASVATFNELPQSYDESPLSIDTSGYLSHRYDHNPHGRRAQQSVHSPRRDSLPQVQPPPPSEPEPVNTKSVALDADAQDKGKSNGLSPCEARVAGVFHEDGRVASVHGLAGIMNPTRRALHKENISKVSRKGEVAVAGSKARLVSNAILQKQRESRLFRQPQHLVDLDGCDPELARHLIDLHFNRHHCSYLLTYRPAIMESIASRGPWVNKLLLNAIYYNSSLYSDRPGLRPPGDDPEGVGSRFYDRFCELLVPAMAKPSIPSAAALLLTSTALVAQGKVSMGWSLSGTAYRMIIDLGCHMMLGPDYQEVNANGSADMLHKDIDHEMRKRLYWGAYTTDVTQSLYLGRQCSFATTEARVPVQLLDEFDELEDWRPYFDITEPAPQPSSYRPQPVYAVSTFTANIQLMQVGALISDLYGISTVGYETRIVLKKKAVIERKLGEWVESLPEHLSFHPDEGEVPPPHQITPHTTYHTLRILLYRAFVEEGHLRRHSDAEAKRDSEELCIASALMIEKYIRSYRNTFTLRRAPVLLSYAIYSAVAIILPQERSDRGHFTDVISFFWTCLSELQHGCNSGLKKPLSVLRDMAREFQLSVRERRAEKEASIDFGTLDESFFPQLPLVSPYPDPEMYSAAQYLQGMNTHGRMESVAGREEVVTPGLMNFLSDQEFDLSQNTLFGLFAPT